MYKLNFNLLTDSCVEYINNQIRKGLDIIIYNGYYASDISSEAVSLLLFSGSNDDIVTDYTTNSYLEKDSIVVDQNVSEISDLFSDDQRLYKLYIEGFNIETIDEGFPNNINHCVVIVCINGVWKMIDSFTNVRNIEICDIDINELRNFMIDNEKCFSMDEYIMCHIRRLFSY